MNLKSRTTFLRFLIAGGFNTLFGWLVYSAAIIFRMPPWLALIVGTVTGIGFNFISLGAYVFRDMSRKRLPLFVLSYGFIYTINLICLKAMELWIDSPIWGQLILTLPMAVLSYTVLSCMVFTLNNHQNTLGDVNSDDYSV